MRFTAATACVLCVSLAGPVMVPAHADAQSIFERVTTRDVTIPAGTRLPIVVDTAVASHTSRVEQPVRAHLSRDVVLNNEVIIPAGSELQGVVTSARRAGKVEGRSHIAIRFDTLSARGSSERYEIQTGTIGRAGRATKKNDAVKIGGPAAGGALIGTVVGGKKGALIGAGVGGGAGTAVVLSTRGEEVGIGRGAAFVLRLASPVTVRVKR